jgi:hypothetical protein
VRVDVLLETFGTNWAEVRDGAVAAERAGFDWVWLNDHLAGAVQGAPYVLKCWTVLVGSAASCLSVQHIGPAPATRSSAPGMSSERTCGHASTGDVALVIPPVIEYHADHDHRVNEHLRFVQITPPGSACSYAERKVQCPRRRRLAPRSGAADRWQDER